MVSLLNALYSGGNIILQKAYRTTEFTNAVEISDQGVVWIDDILVFILQGICIDRLQNNGISSQSKLLKGYGGSMNIYGITVDTPAKDFKAYCQQMSYYEKEFVNMLPQLVG